jgi:hypothetical protein
MLRDTSGSYATSTAGGETVRAFIPQPLPPVPPLDFSNVGWISAAHPPGHQ